MTAYENLPIAAKLLTAGTSACIADFLSYPLDTAKVRLQVRPFLTPSHDTSTFVFSTYQCDLSALSAEFTSGFGGRLQIVEDRRFGLSFT